LKSRLIAVKNYVVFIPIKRIACFCQCCRHVYCPNCGENGHHIDFPQLCYAVTPVHKLGDSGKKRQRRAQEPRQCMEPKYEAFVRYPQCTPPSLFFLAS
jgi:hypothetical protein